MAVYELWTGDGERVKFVPRWSPRGPRRVHRFLWRWLWLYGGGGGGCGCMAVVAVVAVVVVVVAVVAVACKYENHPPNGTSPKYFPGEGSSLGLLGVY